MTETDTRSLLITETDLNHFCREVLKKLDLPADEAGIVADCLVEADLRGVHSHGVIRFPVYIRRLQAGVFNPRPKIRWQSCVRGLIFRQRPGKRRRV